MARNRRKTDYGTCLIHLFLIASFAVLLATGLRIATDDPEARWLLVADAILPVEHLWFRHLIAGVVLIAVLGGYGTYMIKARLTGRIRLDANRLVAILHQGDSRWAALNVLVYWALMALFLTEIASGLWLFAGGDRWIMNIHRDATFACIGFVAAHIALHAASGGWNQLLRIFRPARLILAPPPPDLAELLADQLARQRNNVQAKPAGQKDGPKGRGTRPGSGVLMSHPIVAAIIATLAIGAVAIEAERATREAIHVAYLNGHEPPRLDGDLADPAWSQTTPVSVLTTQGGDFGGSGQSLVQIRAVHDGEYAYFAFVWEDPTRSLKHFPLVKQAGRWTIAATHDDLSDEQRYYEDKFAVLLTPPGFPLIGGAIHLASKPLSDQPPSATGRGLHFTVGSGVADIWQWRASHGGLVGHIDNCHFAGPQDPLVGTTNNDPSEHYAGGFARDPGPVPYSSNIVVQRDAKAQVQPRRLPRDIGTIERALGQVGDSDGVSESETARWWMTEAETVPYSDATDARVPDGTIVPSVVVESSAPLRRDSIRGVARWSAGRWTLEVARRLYTGSRYDVPIKTGALLWVAAFDHSAKRHSRHLRPFQLEID